MNRSHVIDDGLDLAIYSMIDMLKEDLANEGKDGNDAANWFIHHMEDFGFSRPEMLCLLPNYLMSYTMPDKTKGFCEQYETFGKCFDELSLKMFAFLFRDGDSRDWNNIEDLEEKIENCYFANFDELTEEDKQKIQFYKDNPRTETMKDFNEELKRLDEERGDDR